MILSRSFITLIFLDAVFGFVAIFDVSVPVEVDKHQQVQPHVQEELIEEFRKKREQAR